MPSLPIEWRGCGCHGACKKAEGEPMPSRMRAALERQERLEGVGRVEARRRGELMAVVCRG